VTRHAKAPSAGSTQGRSSRSGSFVRGADAIRGYYSDAAGGGAPAHRGRLVAVALAATLLVLALVASSAFASSAPLISAAKTTAVDEGSVRVTATIDPGNSPTTYVVEYGTSTALGSSTEPVSVGAGTEPIEVSPVIGGLVPATQYYFKVVATNLVNSAESESLTAATYPATASFGSCPNERFRTGPSAKLPDCRAYEQATPTDKTGSDVNGTTFSVQASPSGDAITSFALAGFPGTEHFAITNVLMSRFDGGKWSTVGLADPPSYGNSDNTLGWTSDLRFSFGNPLDTSSPALSNALVMRDSVTGARTTLIPQGVGFSKGPSKGRLIGGAFDNDSKVLFAANGNVPITSGPAPVSTTKANVYLYDRDTGSLTLVGVLPDSACATPPCVSEEGSQFPLAFGGFAQDGHVVTPDGDVYFIDGSGKLYLRRDVAGPNATTVQVSASHKTSGSDPNGPQAVNFAGATPSGSKALFMSTEELTDDASTGGDQTQDLYAYDRETGDLADLAPGAEVIGVLGSSDDNNRVYFAANADLDGAGPAAPGDCEPGLSFGSGFCSVYLWQADGTGDCATAGGCISFVVGIESGISGSPPRNWYGGESGGGGLAMKYARVSSDGSTLVFNSQLQLTDYHNQGTAEFYRYDAESGQIGCLTCNPTGAPPVGEPGLKAYDLFHGPTSHLIYEAQPFLSRNLSPNGKRFFFQSTDKLVAADVNGDVTCSTKEQEVGSGGSCLDAYEWEAPGEGTCTENGSAYSPANGGCIYLLSTGTGPYPSYLADVSESGDVAFIFSRQQLVPSDEDNQEDLYAVKVDGGLAADHEARPASCEGDACRGASSQPSSAPGAGTAAFEGPGNPQSNINATHCPKGKRTVHSKGKVRCVAKHKKKAHKHKSKAHKRAANNDRRASR
jgi:hypothetical protein